MLMDVDVCETVWILTLQQHHCRRCGEGMCSKCANTFRKIPDLGVTDMVRVCNKGCEIVYDDAYGDLGGSNGAPRSSSSQASPPPPPPPPQPKTQPPKKKKKKKKKK